MKHLIISIVCMLILIVPWGIYDHYSTNMVEGCKSIIDESIIPAIQSGAWKNAETSFNAIKKEWEKYKKVSAYFIDTASVNEVDGFLSKASCYITMQDTSNAAAECAYIKDRLDFLHENELPSLENIF